MSLLKVVRNETVERTDYYMHDFEPDIYQSSQDVTIGFVQTYKAAKKLIKSNIHRIKKDASVSVQEMKPSLTVWRGGMQWDETTCYTYSIEPV